MPQNKKHNPQLKTQLHFRNRHRNQYDFEYLCENYTELKRFVFINAFGNESIDFSDSKAVKELNTALLKSYYGVTYWDIPKGYLCPPIPGRADYIHCIADVLARSNKGLIPIGSNIKCLDIGVGANCIYPIIGVHEYGWSFIGSDVDNISVTSANKIITLNDYLQNQVEIRLQNDSKSFFKGIIQNGEFIDISICNPPFHSSIDEAKKGTLRKLRNLKKIEVKETVLNFGGQPNELCYIGGEERFVIDMIHESCDYSDSCLWFSTLISKLATLDAIYYALKKAKALDVKTIPMSQGNKISRIVAWTFQSKEKQMEWASSKFYSNTSSLDPK